MYRGVIPATPTAVAASVFKNVAAVVRFAVPIAVAASVRANVVTFDSVATPTATAASVRTKVVTFESAATPTATAAIACRKSAPVTGFSNKNGQWSSFSSSGSCDWLSVASVMSGCH